jgi:hypothetical protein
MERPIIPTFSQQKTERRWRAVRVEMREANLDDSRRRHGRDGPQRRKTPG